MEGNEKILIDSGNVTIAKSQTRTKTTLYFKTSPQKKGGHIKRCKVFWHNDLTNAFLFYFCAYCKRFVPCRLIELFCVCTGGRLKNREKTLKIYFFLLV